MENHVELPRQSTDNNKRNSLDFVQIKQTERNDNPT